MARLGGRAKREVKAAAKEQAKAAKAAEPVDAMPRPTRAQILYLRWFGNLARSRLSKYPMLGLKLAKARNPLVPVAYLAFIFGCVAVGAAVAAIPLLFYLFLLPVVGFNIRAFLPLLVLPGLVGVITYSWLLLKPDLEISSRKRNLESNLPYALNFMAAIASAGVVPTEMFGALGAQSAYGEVAKEASWIHRDTRVFSKDLVGALQAGAKRSPSPQFEEFLQGSVNTITSGGDLKTYLLGKSEQFSQENRRKQKQFLESLGVMAESYVVVAAAAPLFLIVILSVMTLLSKGTDPTFLLNMLVLLALPVIHGSFIWVLRNMRAD
ncbi:MAG: type II secretion system F family protein [Candidatus Thermoplasmatota archaeon]